MIGVADYHRSPEELREELSEQAEALRSSAAAYDAGKLWEAKRLATTSYILLHDGGQKSRSLLGQLGLRGPMLSTADHACGLLPLATVTVDVVAGRGGMTWVPRLDENSAVRQMLPFKKWYKEPVFESGSLRLTRQNLIFTFRHQAGGAHVDKAITDDAFQWLRRDSPIHIKTEPTASEDEYPPELRGMFAEYDGPVPNGHFATMRQIAWELDQKLISLGY